MTVPNITVCMKVVPRPEEVRIDPDTLTLDRNSARSLINPPDMNALELALKLKDRHGGSVRLLAMGPPLFDSYLRMALAMGADEAFLLSDRAFSGADTLATSYTLALGIRKIGPTDLVICGDESSDGATGQVPGGIAEWLNVAQVTNATEVNFIDEGQMRVWRELRGGHEVVVASLPAVVSVVSNSNEPRFMDMSRRARTNDEPITVWSAEDLGADWELIGTTGSPTVVAGIREAEQRERRREFIEGTPKEQARALAEKLRLILEGVPAGERTPVSLNGALSPGGGNGRSARDDGRGSESDSVSAHASPGRSLWGRSNHGSS
jgi:electron transfer flavoprotein beta subunit